MRNLAGALVAIAIVGCSTAKSAAPPSWIGGQDFIPMKGTTLAKVTELPNGTEVQVEGKITKVCQGSGCWVEISDGSSSVICKSFGHKILFPKDVVGKTAIMKGKVLVSPPACGGGKGHDHDEEEEEEEDEEEGAKKHECPKPGILVEVLGARVH